MTWGVISETAMLRQIAVERTFKQIMNEKRDKLFQRYPKSELLFKLLNDKNKDKFNLRLQEFYHKDSEENYRILNKILWELSSKQTIYEATLLLTNLAKYDILDQMHEEVLNLIFQLEDNFPKNNF